MCDERLRIIQANREKIGAEIRKRLATRIGDGFDAAARATIQETLQVVLQDISVEELLPAAVVVRQGERRDEIVVELRDATAGWLLVNESAEHATESGDRDHDGPAGE